MKVTTIKPELVRKIISMETGICGRCTETQRPLTEIRFDLFSGFDGKPAIAFLIEEGFAIDSYLHVGNGRVYHLDLKSLLEDCVSTHLEFDDGENTPAIINLLREYAAKLETDINNKKK
jgi:hypothetical protein